MNEWKTRKKSWALAPCEFSAIKENVQPGYRLADIYGYCHLFANRWRGRL